MARAQRPGVFTIAPHQAFADTLVTGLIERVGAAPLALAKGIILVPNNRAAVAVRDAFVRRAEPALLLPRIVAVGDDELDAQLGAALDPIDDAAIPPAIDPLHRQLMLARTLQTQRARTGDPIDAAEALRLAADLARALDQLTIEGVAPERLKSIDVPSGAIHWERSLAMMTVILGYWPQILAARGQIDLTERRNRQLAAAAARWRAQPPEGFIVAAGVSTASPAVAGLLRVISRLPRGMVVLAGLDRHMSGDDWALLDPATTNKPIEQHPQFHLRLLLDGMGVARDEVELWHRDTTAPDKAACTRTLSHAMALPEATKAWHSLSARETRLPGVTALACDDPGHEAQCIALALREALETPGQTAALITPDRALARRVSLLLRRWQIVVDDSAGQPLSTTRIGSLVLAMIDAAVNDFAPVELMALLKHPLVQRGEARLVWLDKVRALDLALRGLRPKGGAAGIAQRIAAQRSADKAVQAEMSQWWSGVADQLRPLGVIAQGRIASLADAVAALRATLDALCGEEIWTGNAGRAAAQLFDALTRYAADGPTDVTCDALPQTFRNLLDAATVRPDATLHPRLFIWGLIEAKLQTADFVILGGLNEGTWPALPTPDPWLAPAVRKALGLPTLERRIGIAAHDLVGALGAPRVLLTRAHKDGRSQTLASRFWLRLQALCGDLPAPATDYGQLARALDKALPPTPRARQPAPRVPAAARPRTINVTQVDTLRADPYSFYARKILRLPDLDGLDLEPSYGWRGTLTHNALEAWAKLDDFRPDALPERMRAAFEAEGLHPVVQALWLPRLIASGARFAEWIAANRQGHRVPVQAEVQGHIDIHGVRLVGRPDRLDRMVDGTFAIVDYKTGAVPNKKQIEAGFALQLGLLGLMLEAGAFDGLVGTATAFEYWSFKKSKGGLGTLMPACRPDAAAAADFVTRTQAFFTDAVDQWLLGDAPFTARLNPAYSRSTYDHLTRHDEWVGRNG